MNGPLDYFLLLGMNDGQIRLTIILSYLALLLFLGFFASRLFRGTKNDYLLASHSIGPFLLLLSMFGTSMSPYSESLALESIL